MDPAEPRMFVHHAADETVITLNDKEILEAESINELEKEIMLVLDQASRLNLLIDFCNVRFMSSACLGLLLKIHKRVCERQGHLKLCNVSSSLYKVFEITQLNKVFNISQQ